MKKKKQKYSLSYFGKLTPGLTMRGAGAALGAGVGTLATGGSPVGMVGGLFAGDYLTKKGLNKLLNPKRKRYKKK